MLHTPLVRLDVLDGPLARAARYERSGPAGSGPDGDVVRVERPVGGDPLADDSPRHVRVTPRRPALGRARARTRRRLGSLSIPMSILVVAVRRDSGGRNGLGRTAPSPLIELNRAVAVSMATGPADALRIVDRLASEGALRGSHLLPSVRGELLARLGRIEEARSELMTAAGLARNERESTVLRAKAAAL